MRKLTVLGLLAVLLLTVPDYSFAEDIEAYYKIGGELQLRPTFSDQISNILWKLNGDLIAEWVAEIVPLDYYGKFKDRTTLDTTSGILVIKNLTRGDVGTYTVEINNRVHPQRFIGTVIKVVPKPNIWVQPINCHAGLDTCTLICEKGEGELEKAQPVSYEWKEDDGKWQPGKSNMVISNSDSAHIKTFTCKMKNPVSEEESDPKDNSFYKESQVDVGKAVGIPVAVILFILVVLSVVFREKIMDCIPKRQDDGASRTANGHNLGSTSDRAPEEHESSPLHNGP